MIKIRYRDPNELSPGLHAAAERHGRSTTVYLLSGLSVAQRRAALRRLRISARRGYGPRLPAPQLALALAADRVRTTVGQAGAVFRSHPAGSTVPVMVISAGAIAFLALSAVSIRVIHPGSGSPSFAAGPGPAASVRTGPGGPAAAGLAGPGRAGSAGELPGQPGSGSSPGAPVPGGGGGAGPSRDASPSRDAGQGGSAGQGTVAGSGPSTGSGGGTTLTGGAAPTPTPDGTVAGPAPASSSSAPAASATSAAPSPAPSASNSGLCLNVGPLGVCL